MNRLSVIGAFACTLLLGMTVNAAVVQSTFDTDLDGWAKGPTSDPTSSISWISTDGNPGGYLRYSEGGSGGVDRIIAPAKFLGDKSSFYGGTFSYDRRTNSTSNPTSYDDDLNLTGGGIAIRYDLGQPTLSWVTSTIDLLETAGWINIATGLAPTQSDFLAVLADLTELRLHADYRSGFETPSFDNIRMVSAVPEPATFAAGLLGLVALARRRR
jgi:alkaline phosphatase D